MECVKRKVGHICIKDERQPRAKRAKAGNVNDDDGPSHPLAISHTTRNDSPTQGNEVEEIAEAFEHFVDGLPRVGAHVLGHTPLIISDLPNMYWSKSNDPRRNDEKLELFRDIVDAMPDQDMINLLYEVFATRCQGPLNNITHTSTFTQQADIINACLDLPSLEEQVMALSSTISMDAIACHLMAVRVPSCLASNIGLRIFA